MRDLLILGGVGILSTAAWTVTTVTADDGAHGMGRSMLARATAASSIT